ncbi:MAG: hypothetical protein ABSH45_01935 [Bryobacteraceae bacterium]|jgi:hypothetical protein
MADFRRIVLVLAVLALFAGLAGAQSTVLQCNATTVPPQLRSEGITELMGDIVLNCAGGTATPVGQTIQQANFVVYTNTTVTSRLLSGSASEALLLIDEPGSGLNTWGAAQPITACATPLSGCPSYAAQTTFTPTGGAAYTVTYPAAYSNAAYDNMYFGIVSGSSVTFNGVPVLAPSSIANRVYRITNVRVNASAITGGTLPGNIIGDVAISGSTSVNVNNSALTTGYVAQSLKTSLRNYNDSGSLSSTSTLQCVNYYGSSSSQPWAWGQLRFSELFASAFKTRVNPYYYYTSVPGSYSPQSANAEQNIPGYIYTSESGFTPYDATSVVNPLSGVTPGLADFGTRIAAVFSNIPAGASVYVGTGNVSGSSSTTVTLLPSATYLYGTGTLVGLTATTSSVGSPAPAYTYPAVQLAVTNGTAMATWEITTTSTSTLENVDIPVAILYVANPTNNLPAIGTATVNMRYAPDAADIGAADTTASSSQPIPRFIDTSSANSVFTTTLCTTSLLFPYVTEIAGFDTGLSIANTSSDPFGTAAQTGTCTLYWYGTAAPANTVTAAVAAGTIWTGLTSLLAPGFNGYMIATCNFEYAHGFAFVSDLGARNLAMGYLALVLNAPSGAYRPVPTGENLEN